MYIMTEDRKSIIDASGFTVERTLGNKNGKYAVTAISKVAVLVSTVVSSWPDEESAMRELQEIWKAMQAGESFYQKNKSL